LTAKTEQDVTTRQEEASDDKRALMEVSGASIDKPLHGNRFILRHEKRERLTQTKCGKQSARTCSMRHQQKKATAFEAKVIMKSEKHSHKVAAISQ
jgi:hypothetical protein